MAYPLWNRFVLSSPKSLSSTSILAEYQQLRSLMGSRHREPKWRNLRRLKVMTPDPLPKMKPFLLKDGKLDYDYWYVRPQPFRIWTDREVYTSTTNQVIEPYAPPEDDASRSSIIEKGKNLGAYVKDTGKDKIAMRKIRQYESEFNAKVFIDEAKEVYLAAHECLAMEDYEKLTDYVTEMARSTMLLNVKNRRIHWKYLQSLEEPRIVQVRHLKLDGDDDVFAQVTVRLHSQQMLAVYDRFGRLMYGSEVVAKDVLEYVVFEKHISNEYGLWRVHAKIIPDCMIRPSNHTYVKPMDEGGVSAREAAVEAVEVEPEKSAVTTGV